MSKLIDFLDVFCDLTDPRIDRKKLHPMPEILLVTLCGVIAGCDGWGDIEDFGKSKLGFLQGFLAYENGIPSDDTLRRFFRAVDPKSFEKKFSQWAQSFELEKEITISIDGKTSKRTHDGDKKPLHLVSAFASEARIVLGQTKVSEKSNEITAIPELLEWLDIRGATVTIDAMGCQKDIAQKIREKGGDYVLALKGNQGNLEEEVRTFFSDFDQKNNFNETVDGDHGRIEVRHCFASEDINWITGKSNWSGLKSIVMIKSEREIKNKKSTENRYYLSSLPADQQRLQKAIRNHWGVESMHWIMDMSFGDDQSRIRKGNSPENMALIRHFALNLLQKYKKKRQTIKRLRKKAGWDNRVLKEILVEAS